MKYFKLLLLSVFCFSCFMLKNKSDSMQPLIICDTLKEQCIQILRTILHTQSKWVKVHAAEYLLWSGYHEEVRETFINEEQRFAKESPYRIGIWRVLAQCNEKEKKVWTNKIFKAFQDTNGVDRVHAAETLAKLGISPLQDDPKTTKLALEGSDKLLALYTRWSVSFSSEDSLIMARSYFFKILTSKEVTDPLTTRLAAYVIRQLGGLTIANWNLLSKRALSETYNSEVRIYLLSAAFTTASMDAVQSNLFKEIRKELIAYCNTLNKSDQMEVASALSGKGTKEDLPVLISMLNSKSLIGIEADDADVKASVAYAILKINESG